MRIFARKTNVSPPPASAALTSDQVGGRQRPKASPVRQETPAAGPAWNFSRIPVRAVAPAGLQTKLELGAPGDACEQEADRVAAQVMRMPEPTLQSKAPADISGHATGSAARVQTKSTQTGSSSGVAAPPIVHEVLRSPGQPLDAATRSFMEPRFGHDFSGVRVHADARAAESARSVHALAYTAGQHVAFRTNSYRPATPAGRHLLAHELAHVVQQRSHGAGSGGVQRQLDGAELTGDDKDDPWQKALLEAKRRVFGGSTGKPLQSDALTAPAHDPFFPRRFAPGVPQGSWHNENPPSYAKKPAGEDARSGVIGQVGLRPDQLTSEREPMKIGAFDLGVDKTIDIDDQQRDELKKVRESFTNSKDMEPEFKRQKTGSGAELNLLGNYETGAEGLKFDPGKVSAALGAKIPFSLLKRMFGKTKRKPNDAFVGQ